MLSFPASKAGGPSVPLFGRRLRATLLCWVFGCTPLTAAEPLEYQVKAAFLYNFARFIEWPAATGRDGFAICVLGEDPFGSALQGLTRKRVRGVPIRVRRLRAVAEGDHCQVLFIAASERHALVEALAYLAGRPVLTVSDIGGFTELGGIVELYIENKRVRFAINPAAAAHSGLKVSSKLLSLARVVRRTGRAEGGTGAYLR